MARVRLWLAIALLATIASAAHADPISIIGGVMAYYGAGAVVGAEVLGTVAFAGMTYGALAFAAGSLVFGTLNARRQARQAEAAARNQHNASLQDRLVTALSTNSPWQIIYGTAEVGGSLETILTSGDRDQFKHLVIVLAAHACEGIVDIKIAGESIGPLDAAGFVTTGKWFKSATETYSELVTFDASGNGTITRTGAVLQGVVIAPLTGGGEAFAPQPEQKFDAATLTGTTVSGGPISQAATVTYTLTGDAALVRVQKHLGADDQLADATLVAECPGQWSATDRLQGLTYIVVRLNLTEPEFQGGPPAITAVVNGKQVYDHRNGSTLFSENVALCVADYLMAPYGKDARNNQIIWDTVDAAANACDEVIAGGQVRFTCNGAFSTDQSTDAVLEDLLGAMAGWADGSGGWRIGAGVWTPPVTTITDDDNAGPVQIIGGLGLDEIFNGVRGQFNDPDRFGVATDFPPYQNAAFVTADDGRQFWSDVNLPFTNKAQRATNLARIMVESARGETLSYPAKKRVVNRVKVGERLLLDCPSLGINTVAFRLVKREENPGGIVLLTMQQDLQANYDEADAVAPVPSSSNGLVDLYAVPAVVGLTLDSGEQYALVTATSIVPRVLVAVSGLPQLLTDQLQIEWRTSASDTWQALAVTPGQTTAFIENVNQGVTYFVRARWYRPSVKAASDWRVDSITVTGKTTPPPPFDTVSVTELDTGGRVYAFAYTTTPQPVDWKGAEIRYIAGTTATPDWNAMTPLAGAGTWFTASQFESVKPTGTGPYTFAFRSRDSGGLSTMTVFNVTLGLNALDIAGPKVALRTSALAFIKPKNGGALTPATITLTASVVNMPTPVYAWKVDGVLQAGATASTFDLAAFSGNPKQVRVDVTSGAKTAFDTFTIYSVSEGDDAITAGLTNENQSVLVDAGGTPVAGQLPLSTQMLVARGATILSAGVTYSVAAQTGCTATIDAAGVASVTAISADVASVTFRATVTATATVVDKVLTLNKSYPGAAGTPGGTGPTGTRGSRQLYAVNAAYTASYNDGSGAGAASYKHQSTVQIAAATTGTTPTTPIKGDTVTFTNGSNYVTTYTNNGTYATNGDNSWALPGTVLDGSVLVSGSVTAAAINVVNLSALSANLGTVTSGNITSSANISIAGTCKVDGLTTDGGATCGIVANSSYSSSTGLKGYGTASGYGAMGVAGASTALGGVGGISNYGTVPGGYFYNGSSGSGLVAEGTTGPAFQCKGTITWNGYSYALPGGSNTLCPHGDGIWRDPVTTARVTAAFGVASGAVVQGIGPNAGAVVYPSGGAISILSTVSGVQTSGSGTVLTIQSVSDRRLKEDIVDEHLGLDFVLKQRVVSYRMIGDPTLRHGWIYQEVAKHLEGDDDSLAKRNADGFGGVDTTGMTAVTMLAVQQLYAVVAGLGRRIEQLKKG
jgi:hypothetical protein